jgi:predicted Zn-dependent protease
MTKKTPYYKVLFMFGAFILMASCSLNEATGEKQFTPFMPASTEAKIGAQEHTKILQQYGGEVDNPKLKTYFRNIGYKLVPHTERDDVKYTFYIVDSPIINAFALPGGYIYISRGLLAIMQNEAQLAAILGHEIGHVTARHSAERYNTSVFASLGTGILSTVIDVPGLNQALGLGTNLYLSSYSRSQESQSDALGVRYIAKAGYNPSAMANVHRNMLASKRLAAKEVGKDEKSVDQVNYFATHPISSQRIVESDAEATKHTPSDKLNRNAFLNAVNGMIYGDSASQGFVNKGQFIHPELRLAFKIPKNYATNNTPSQFIASAKRQNGPTLIFNGAQKQHSQTISDFLQYTLLKGNLASARDFTTTTINGKSAATVEVSGTANNVQANIRIVAIEWSQSQVYIFKLIFPSQTSNTEITQLKDSAFSLRSLTASETQRYQPKRIKIFTAITGDSVSSRANKMPFDDGLNIERFRVINGLGNQERLIPGMKYKTIRQ